MTIPVTRPPAADPSPARVLAAVRNVLDTNHTPIRALRDWLWQHTAQPNGDPWSADPEALATAARDLADFLRGA